MEVEKPKSTEPCMYRHGSVLVLLDYVLSRLSSTVYPYGPPLRQLFEK